MDNKIDIVILWVNDRDENWREKKDFWEKELNIYRDEPERYRDWNNLQYLFRGIEKFAPWANHIYLVTDNQKPEWLNIAHEKISIIDHKDIMPNESLPTFNSQAIELCLHNIEGLSEFFLYFNDDIFIIDHVNPDDFFIDGKPKLLASLDVIIPKKDEPIYRIMYNNTSIINDSFDKKRTLKNNIFNWLNFKYGRENIRTFLNLFWSQFPGFFQPHSVGVFRKSTFKEVWAKYPKELRKTVESRFRREDNYNQWLIRDWQLASNNFVPQSRSFSKNYSIKSKTIADSCAAHIKNQKSKLVCVNDNEYLEDFDYARNTINQSLQYLLPDKSQFEK